MPQPTAGLACERQAGWAIRQSRVSMLMTRTGATLFATFVVLAGICGAGAGQSVGQDEAMDAVLSFVRANEKGDLDSTLATFATDATVFLPADPPQRATGTVEIREVFRRTYARRNGPITISFRDGSVQRYGDTAIVTGHLGVLPALPVTEATTFARRTFVLRRTGTRWLIVHLHASNVLLSPPK